MDIELLRIFVEVSRCGSVTSAARALGVSQPTLSRQIRRLEAELGVHLLDRSATGVVLTPAGRRVLTGARGTVRSFDAMTEVVAAVSNRQPLRLGMPTLAMELLVDELMTRLHRPGNPLRLSVSEGTNPMLIEAVRAGQLDMAIATEVLPSAQFKSLDLWTEQLFVVGRCEAVGLPPAMSLAEVAKLPLVLGRPADPIRKSVEATFRRLGLELHVDMELEGISSIKRVVESKRIWALVPWLSVRSEVEAGRLSCSAVEGLFIRRCVITPTGAAAQPRTRAVLRLLQELTGRLLADKSWAQLPRP